MRRIFGATAWGAAGFLAVSAGTLSAQAGTTYASCALGPAPGALRPLAVGEKHRETAALPGAPLVFPSLELAGRYELHRLDPTRPRRIVAEDGIVRVRLPNGFSIYRYRRAVAPPLFGFLAVGPDGLHRVLLELPGIGVGGAVDPFHPFLGARRDGARVAFATTEDAGGRVFLVRPDGLPLASGAPLLDLGAGFDVAPESLTFGAGRLFFRGADDAIHRAPDDGSAPASAVPIPPSGGAAPIEIEDEFAVSDDGSTVAFLAGADEDHLDLYLAFASGAVVNFTQNPGEIDKPGHAPATAFGPMLALSPDGSRVAYLRKVGASRELFVETVAAPAPMQVTADPFFEPSIDNVIIVTFVSANDMVFGASGGNGLSALDVYRADFAGGGMALANVTVTSGAAIPPFPNLATIDLGDALVLPGGGEVVVANAGAGFTIHGFDPAGGVSTPILAGSGTPGPWAGSADRALFAATVAGAKRVYRASGSAGGPPSATSLLALPAGLSLEALVPEATGSEALLLVSGGPALDLVARIDSNSGALSLLFPFPLAHARSLAWSPSRAALFAAGAISGGPYLFLRIAPTGPLLLDPAAQFGTFLP